jgi:hypothetical protein
MISVDACGRVWYEFENGFKMLVVGCGPYGWELRFSK